MATQNHIIRGILQYRNKHHRCRYCLFHTPIGMGYYKCILKDIPLVDRFFLGRGQGAFCRGFKAREDNIEIQITNEQK